MIYLILYLIFAGPLAIWIESKTNKKYQKYDFMEWMIIIPLGFLLLWVVLFYSIHFHKSSKYYRWWRK